MGIEIGLAWGEHASLTVVGVDRGVSTGMVYGINRARAEKRPIFWLSLESWRGSWKPPVDDDWGKYALPIDERTIQGYPAVLT